MGALSLSSAVSRIGRSGGTQAVDGWTRRRIGLSAGLIAAGATALGLIAVAITPSRVEAAVQTYPAPASGTWTVTGHGNGHGHGLSQYGSYGRAAAGQTMPQIVSFYYPNTTLQVGHPSVANTSVRVQISSAGSFTTIAAVLNLHVTGLAGSPSTSGVNMFRLVPQGAGLALQSHVAAGWTTVAGNLPSSATFSIPAGELILIRADGSRAAYRGSLSAVRSGSSDLTVNTVRLDDYVRGVAPNESPSSWPAAALQSQVVAARTYALFEVKANAGAGAYDLCDTSSCQVYRGASSEAASTNAAVDATSGDVLLYGGAPIFAQFSSSNGGWTADGGKPYLVARPDPYDNATVDPWFSWTRKVAVSQVASAYGLSTVTAIRVLSRDGHGDWGGEVLTAAVDGTLAGKAVSVATTGLGLRSAMGLPLQWFTLDGQAGLQTPTSGPGQVVTSREPRSLTVQPGTTTASVGWTIPAPGGAAVTGYRVSAAGVSTQTVPATARSAALTGLVSGRSYRVAVTALSAAGPGGTAVIEVIATAPPAGAPNPPTLLSQWPSERAAQLYWARSTTVGVTGYSVTVLGVGRWIIPASATHYTLSGLTDGFARTVYVRAIGVAGESAAAGVSIRPVPVQSPPASVQLVSVPGSVTVSWPAAVTPGVPTTTAYSVTLLGAARQVTAATVRSAVFTGLHAGSTYKVYVRAVNSYGEGPAYMTSVVAR